MVNLTWLNIDFVRVLELAAEFGRVVLALDFRPPPPTYTFRALEPLYKQTIEHFQERCEQKYRVINDNEVEKEVENENARVSTTAQQFDDLEDLLQRHARLIHNLNSLIQQPHRHPRKHSDEMVIHTEDVDSQLGPERYIEPPFKGYGFSNDTIRQWLAVIPGRIGQHFEAEEAASVNLTAIFQQIIVALVGGASLLVPMIIMTFTTGINVRLIVVSVATILFGVAFALVSSSKESVLAGTAAYAAVMVVYIGSASPTPNQP